MESAEREEIRILETLEMIPKDVHFVLDVGCGDGIMTKSIQEKFNITGIDIDRGKIQEFHGKKIIANISQLPIKHKKFDLVLITEVLEHLENDNLHNALNEIFRVAYKYILITVPFKETLSAEWVKCSKCNYVFHAWGHLRSFNKDALEKLFKNAIKVKTKLLSPKETWVPSLLYFIAKKMGNTWGFNPQDNPVCPKCGSSPLESEGNILGRIFTRIIWKIVKVSPTLKSVWIGVLFKKI